MIDRTGLHCISKPSHHHQCPFFHQSMFRGEKKAQEPQSPQKHLLGEGPHLAVSMQNFGWPSCLTPFNWILRFTEKLQVVREIAESQRKGDRGEGCKRRGAGGFALDAMVKYRCWQKGGSGGGDFDVSTVTCSFNSVLSVHIILLRDTDCVTGRGDVTE